MSSPHFIIIGAMKCGTTTLAAQLDAQKGIFITVPKEPNYFSDDAVYGKGGDYYASLFSDAAPGDIRGEASTNYTKRPKYPDTISRMLAELPDDIRLVYMIRNPLDRLVSHYIHEWSQGILSDPLDKTIDSHVPLVDYGRFGWQIAPYVEAFGRDAILLTSLARLKAAPTSELTRIARHIGATGQVAWVREKAIENVSAERIRRIPFHNVLVDSRSATVLRHILVPARVRTWIRRTRQMRERPVISDADRLRLKERFREDHALLASFFPDDPSLPLTYPFLDE